MSAPSAAWPVDTLVGALCRSGWGDDLDGRRGQGMRSTLRALVDLLPHGSAHGDVTIGQIADAAGLSIRWASVCMHRLIDLGVIKWTRGHIRRGQPLPGSVLIVKKALAQLVTHLRRLGRLDDRRRDRAAARDRRLAKYPATVTLWPSKRRNPLSVHTELSSALPFHREETGRSAGPGSPSNTEEEPMMCIHDHPHPHRCALCRRLIARNTNIDPSKLIKREVDKPPVPMPAGIKARLAGILHPHAQDRLL